MVELEPEDRRKLDENARELIFVRQLQLQGYIKVSFQLQASTRFASNCKASPRFLESPKYLRGLNSNSEVSVDCLFVC